jgi:hypothetical protein
LVQNAFAAIKADGSITAWGDSNDGGTAPELEDYWKKTVEKWRFPEVNVSSARNNFDGYYNAPNHPNYYAFATLQDDGSITACMCSHQYQRVYFCFHYPTMRLTHLL